MKITDITKPGYYWISRSEILLELVIVNVFNHPYSGILKIEEFGSDNMFSIEKFAKNYPEAIVAEPIELIDLRKI